MSFFSKKEKPSTPAGGNNPYLNARIGGTLAGTARTLWQASRESAQDRESRQNTVGSSLRTMLEAARAKNLK